MVRIKMYQAGGAGDKKDRMGIRSLRYKYTIN
jgi:hypothetical protein